MSFTIDAITGNGIPKGWNIVKVSSVAQVNRESIDEKAPPQIISYIDISSVGERVISPLARMDYKNAPSRARRKVRKGDTMISCVRPNLRHFVYLQNPGNDWIASTGFAVVSPTEKINERYLYYWLTSDPFTQYLTQVADGAAYPAFNPSEIEEAEIPSPPLPEQRRIGDLLGSLDDKIELNRRMNETLEAMARAIFKSWFVDLIETEIPAGWKETPLSEVIVMLSGGTPKTSISEYWNGPIPWVSVVDTVPGPYIITTEKLITQAGVDDSAAAILPQETVVITARGTVGNCALMASPMAMNQSCYGLRGKNGAGQLFVFHQIRQQIGNLQAGAHGSVFDTITRDTFNAINIFLPPVALIKKFDALVRPIYDLVLSNQKESRTLAAIRDALLPKLMSGEIRL